MLKKELSDALVVFGFVLTEVALVFDWVSGTSGGATYENSPLFVMILLANLILAHAPLSVTNYLAFAASVLSVAAYISGMALAIASWWRRRLSSVAGGLVMVTVVLWLALFLGLSPIMGISIDSGLYVAALGGLLLFGAYVFGRPEPSKGNISDRAAALRITPCPRREAMPPPVGAP